MGFNECYRGVREKSRGISAVSVIFRGFKGLQGSSNAFRGVSVPFLGLSRSFRGVPENSMGSRGSRDVRGVFQGVFKVFQGFRNDSKVFTVFHVCFM